MSVYYINHSTCFSLFDHHLVCLNKNGKYVIFMLNCMIEWVNFSISYINIFIYGQN
jgi:hypothetical protein